MNIDPIKLPALQERLENLETSISEIEHHLRSYNNSLSSYKSKPREDMVKPGNFIIVAPNGTIIEYGDEIPWIFGEKRALKDRHISVLFREQADSEDIERIFELGSGESCSLIGVHVRGFEIPLQITNEPEVSLSDGQIRLAIEDKSIRGELEQVLEESRESYHILAETASDAILLIGFDFTIQFANSAVQRIFGYKRENLEGRSMRLLFPESRYSKYEKLIKKYFFIDDTHRKETGLQNTIEVLGKTKQGELVPLEISFGNSKGVEDSRVLTCIVRDIALRKKAERRLKFLAYHDKLTSLGNRDRLTETIDQLLAEMDREPERRAALMFLDLDGFKKVNDSLGHEMGDLILKESARRLSNCIRQEDNVYRIQMEDIFRLGGDEFTVLLPKIRKPEEAAIVAKRIIEKILEPFTIEGYGAISDISMGVSVGIALIPDDGTDKTTILRNADAAMYNAKEIGNTYVFFTNDMNNKAVERLMLEEGLRRSVDNQDFELHYQPIVDRRGSVKGLEALIRWNHPERGSIAPQKFIPVAEDTRLILPIGRWVIESAARHMKYLISLGAGDLYVSLNVSPVQLEKEEIGEVIAEILQKVDLDPRYVVIELTETSLMGHPETAIEKMERITQLNPGIRIAVDDFGTGYSSLGYLSRFPVGILKIDRTFVMYLSSESSNVKIIDSILGLGNSLNMDIIAEGVETKEQLKFLTDRKCNLFQGYFFSKPLSMQEMVKFLGF